jgi:uncharacterized surface protein with fasciclin (FAS1) repeats
MTFARIRPKSIDILAAMTAAGTFSVLVKAIKSTGFSETLHAKGPYTVFAPSDGAFAKVPSDRLDALFRDFKDLRAVLKDHVVSGRILAADLVRYHRATPRTLGDRLLPVTVRSGQIFVDDRLVVRADMLAWNGVIHQIDEVLLPESASLIAVH